MKVFFILSLLALLINFKSVAQSYISGKGTASVGYENNVFNSPEIYQDRAGTIFGKSDLLESGVFVDYGWYFKYRSTINKKHKFSVLNNGSFTNFIGVNNANQGRSAIIGTYSYRVNKKTYLGYTVDIRRSKTLVTNILGDEVTAPFTYTELVNEAYIQYAFAKNNVTKLGSYYQIRRYKADPNTESLSYNTPAIEFSTEQVIPINQIETKLEFSIYSKKRNYTERTAKDANGNSQIGYPTRDWSYLGASLTYDLRFNNGLRIEPLFAFTKRQDNFEGQFSYQELKSGIKVSYLFADRALIELRESNYNRNYDIRPALQADGTEIPLKYKYLIFSLKGEYYQSKKLAFFVRANHVSRESNVSNIGKRPRRSYNTFEVLGGVEYRFQKRLKAK